MLSNQIGRDLDSWVKSFQQADDETKAKILGNMSAEVIRDVPMAIATDGAAKTSWFDDLLKYLKLKGAGSSSKAIAQVRNLSQIDSEATALGENLRKNILDGIIKKTTGGKIDSKALTVAVDSQTGEMYYGVSGLKGNPTTTPTNYQMQKILNDMPGSVTNYPINNCAEYNAINNALNNGSSIGNLRLYTIDIKSGAIKIPCNNCSWMYGDYVGFIK